MNFGKHALIFRRISRRSLLLLILDACAVFVALACAVRIQIGSGYYEFLMQPLSFLSVVVFLVSFYIFDLYYPFKYFKIGQTFIDVFYGVGLGTVVLAAISYFDRTYLIPRSVFLIAFCFLALFVFLIRLGYDFIFKARFLKHRALVIGTGSLAHELAHVIERTPYSGIEVIAFVSGTKENEIPNLIEQHQIQMLILATEAKEKYPELNVGTLTKLPVKIVSALHLFEDLDGAIPYQALNEHYFLGFEVEAGKKNYLKVKRILDLLFSSLLLIVLAPIFTAAAFGLMFQTKGKIFYIQKRIGKGASVFHLIKFRTMIDGENGEKQISHLGEWLRRYRIDEIPQLVNVLKGDMSLVGPRPEMLAYVEQCRSQIPFYDTVFAVRPGLTGWAQVNFRHVTDFKDYPRKFSYNLFYLKNISMALDFLIILKTIRIVLLGKGK